MTRRPTVPEPMTEQLTPVHIAGPTTAAFIEKAPLERYVPPKKPSLVGMSRAALADALGTVGLGEKQRKMRVQQIWHWLYVRGATRFDQMTSVSKELHAVLDRHFT